MNNVKKILVIGAGIAGLTAAETLRRWNSPGQIMAYRKQLVDSLWGSSSYGPKNNDKG
jgi:cation diffusion facilitator CzcD-associated flavoprotein CzcO